MDTVELRPAFMWDCEECGRENFTRAIVPEMSVEDLAELKEDHGIEENETGEFLMMPKRVTCPDCGNEFRSYRMGMEEEDE